MDLDTIKDNLPQRNFGLTRIQAIANNKYSLVDNSFLPQAPNGMRLVIWDKDVPLSLDTGANPEIVKITAVEDRLLTFERAQEGTPQRTIAVGDYVAWSITTGWLDDLIDQIKLRAAYDLSNLKPDIPMAQKAEIRGKLGISDSPNPGTSEHLYQQFSTDGNSWHALAAKTANDKFYRIAVASSLPPDNSNLWGEPIRFNVDPDEDENVYIQLSTNNAAWHNPPQVDADKFYRIAVGSAQPANDSARWGAGIRLGGSLPDLSRYDNVKNIADAPHPLTESDKNTLFVNNENSQVSVVHRRSLPRQPATAEWEAFTPPNYRGAFLRQPDTTGLEGLQYYFDLTGHQLMRLNINVVTNTRIWVYASWTEIVRNAVFLGDTYGSLGEVLSDIPVTADLAEHTYIAIVRGVDGATLHRLTRYTPPVADSVVWELQTIDVSPSVIRDKLVSLQGDNRLPASAIKDLHEVSAPASIVISPAQFVKGQTNNAFAVTLDAAPGTFKTATKLNLSLEGQESGDTPYDPFERSNAIIFALNQNQIKALNDAITEDSPPSLTMEVFLQDDDDDVIYQTDAEIAIVSPPTSEGGEDATARAAAAAASAAAATADGKAVAARNIANSNRDQIIAELVQGSFYGGNSSDIIGTYHLNIQTNTGAFPTAILISAVAGGASIIRTGYDPALTQRSIQFGITESAARNLFSNGDLVVGTTLRIQISLLATGGVSLATYNLDVPIVAKPATAPDVDQTARNAAAAAQRTATTAAQAAATADGKAVAAQNTADTATTPTEATTIADQRARVRYTDAEKTKLANLGGGATPTAVARASGTAKTGTYTLLAAQNFIKVRINIDGANPVRNFYMELIRQDLTSVAQNFMHDSRLPMASASDAIAVLNGITASLSGNTLSLNVANWNVGNRHPGLSIVSVHAW